ncbi:nucleotidyl transferase AbiEii/AbiGii toxin family protein [Pelomonas sp. BJYL3]|uniref:nucleotidyl transferase AbiEii/AbiGii toxin family protein n=1 Tax=Pelomonas sp. BJYL3 TaxID=2976697 RepID=UPI0022B39D5D|nr:nucleotidyl transferase AbiEii/AbiGii toxin family protein [Pelomonas sp. BJYL3]
MPNFLHDRRDFAQLVSIVADERGIDPVLVEKDYWIMHCLWGLQSQGFRFELKGGTSLSKGFGVIHRFSEDIDIRIEPPESMEVRTGRNQDKPAHVESRRAFYDWLAAEIKIPGVLSGERDTAFDDEKLRSAGVRLIYPTVSRALEGVKTGILLELGFDDTAPNRAVTISSWAYDTAVARGVKVADNRAQQVPCYAPTHTFVEKLQTISTKYRRLDAAQEFPKNFMRHYYDVYCLLDLPEVQEFLGQAAYEQRKQQRFRGGDELQIAKNAAFRLEDAAQRQLFSGEYQKTAALYYLGQPPFEDLLNRIHEHILVM